MQISNKDIAHLLRSVAAAYTLSGVNRFRILAYEEAADTLEHINREIYDLWQNQELQNVPGIGATIGGHLDEYFKKKGAASTYLVSQTAKYPQSVYEMMKVPGIGAKRAYVFAKKFRIEKADKAIEGLLKAAQDGKIAPLEGFGKKSEEAVIEAVKVFKGQKDEPVRMALPLAHRLASELVEYMKGNKAVKKIDALGSLRRGVATIGDIDLAVVANPKDHGALLEHFIKYPGRVKTEGKGDKKASMAVAGGRHVDLRVAEADNYGSMLQYFTGSKAHNIKLREYGLKKGYSLNEFGIKSIQDTSNKKQDTNKRHLFKNEEDFYNFLGLPWIPPEIREGTDEVDRANSKKLPKLVEVADIIGDFHIHSNYNLEPSHDLGQSTILELIKKARQLKYEYIAISDHNPAQMTHTEAQMGTIMKKRYRQLKSGAGNFPLIVSCEVDILPDGTIALPETALEFVDMIIISIHSSFRQSREQMTKRILLALGNPKVKILGHPTGRLLGKRQEIEADWTTIFKECLKRNIAVEINSWYERLDLPDILVREAKQIGVKFVIDTDAHAAEQMDNMFYGVSVARRGWLEKNDIINAKSLKEVNKWIEK